MGEQVRVPTIVVAALVLVVGIIHFGVAIGCIAKYNRYKDIFQQAVGLSGFNIVIGLYGIAVGIMGLIAIMRRQAPLGRGTGIAAAVLGAFAVISLIVALALNGQAISFIRRRLTNYVTSYAQVQNSINVIDALQSNYRCCGVNLWLDWGRVSLGATNGVGTGTGIGTGTGTGTGTVIVTNGGTGTGTGTIGTGTGTIVGRDTGMRHAYRDSSSLGLDAFPIASVLMEALRRKRQVLTTGNNLYNLPSTYSIVLPFSCCQNGATTATNGQSLGGYCTYSAGNGTINFYVDGCIAPVSNAVVSYIMAFGVINTCMAIVAFVLLGLLRSYFPEAFDTTNPQNKQPLQNEIQSGQQQNQYTNGSFYAAGDPNAYYGNPPATYVAPTYVSSPYGAPTYAAPVGVAPTYPIYQAL